MSDKDHMELDAKDFSELKDRYKFIGEALYLYRLYQEDVRHERYLKNKLTQGRDWISYLNGQELMLVGGLDREVAESLHNRSQKKPYEFLSLLERLEKKKIREWMMGLTVEDSDYEYIYPQSDDHADDGGASSEAKSKQTDEGTKIVYYNAQGREEISEKVENYRLKWEEVKQMQKKRN